MKNQSHRIINGKMAKPVPDVLNTWARIDGTVWYKCMRGKSKGKYLKRKTFKSNCGYQTITIGNKENRKTKNLHIVLLEAWFGKRPAKNYQGAHWDGNKSNKNRDIFLVTEKYRFMENRFSILIFCSNIFDIFRFFFF